MNRYVLDTHAFVFALHATRKLGRRARSALKRVDLGRDEALVPAPVVAEVLLLRERRRGTTGIPEVKAALAVTRWRFLPLDLDQLERFADLAVLVDPFDRLIVAAALCTDAKLISSDQRISESGLVDVVWD
jgi:PIN domain nuclease of toxin-antitoxin system